MPILLKKELGVVENSYYEATVTRPPAQPALAQRLQADVCVVGGGYAGLSAALELAQRGYAVVLLEAQRLGWGASGRNGGQVIVGFGSDGEEAIERQFGADEACRAWDITVDAMRLLQQRIARFGIACEWQPGYLSLATRPRKAQELRRWMEHVQSRYDYPLQWVDTRAMRQWVDSPRFHSAVYDAGSGHLHPLKYCLGLAGAASVAGVRVFENSPVFLVERGRRPVVRTAQGECTCEFVVLAGNVYLGEYGDAIAPEVSSRIMPVGTYMVATERMAAQRAAALIPSRCAASDTNFILDYFRLSADDRLLFGGGDSYSATTPRNLIGHIRRSMTGVFPQLADLEVEHAWGGFVDITMNMAPHFGRLGANIYFVQGFSGHGLALSGMAGLMVAEAIAGQAERFDLLARIRHLPFPGGALMRTPALVLGMWYYRLRDAL
ncbi:MAG TPA: FAD-binding oxidoreductase [Ramlibacter sp.]|uniref:NAD(P)/FAD-dependent oxidoreductase n=1 Tax=Ramlibacter sp. TaxID=1917967 RepID=UPI002D80A80D|nr:FAD-binding oxidoreductase [Ramlibacter sp.]HET8748554.1 FAD-binding oxidoreductase [Ramlibacter sp.]